MDLSLILKTLLIIKPTSNHFKKKQFYIFNKMNSIDSFNKAIENEIKKLNELNEGLLPLSQDLIDDLNSVKKRYINTLNNYKKVISIDGEKESEYEGKRIIENTEKDIKRQEELNNELTKDIIELTDKRNNFVNEDISNEIKELKEVVEMNELKIKELRENLIPNATKELREVKTSIDLRRKEEINVDERVEVLKNTLKDKEREYKLLKAGNILPKDYEVLISEIEEIKSQIDYIEGLFQQLGELLFCSKCNNILFHPYTLYKCGHTYCAECLGIYPDQIDEDSVPKDINYVYNYLLDNRKNLINMFSELDKNSDGVLTYTEFVQGFSKLGIEVEEGVLDDIWTFTDVNGSGTMEYSEFFQILSHTRRESKTHGNTDKNGIKYPQRIDVYNYNIIRNKVK